MEPKPLELGALEEAGLEKSDGAVDPPNSEEPEVDEPNKPGEEEGGAKLKPEDAAELDGGGVPNRLEPVAPPKGEGDGFAPNVLPPNSVEGEVPGV
mmetsp:Transcript_20408/g.56877  ORF Transcript_20408/g.56877 Transcript_20408/m.56877 type:complete len:96 (-) Transcript_20408:144-431(-)